MTRVEGSVFTNTRVLLDGNQYIKCVFDRCEMVFTATAPVGMKDCIFNDVRWTLDGAAGLTIAFLTGLYHGGGRGGQELVENLFQQIRQRAPQAAK